MAEGDNNNTVKSSTEAKEEQQKTQTTLKTRDTVKLISAEGVEFVISREAAYASKTLKIMLTNDGFAEARSGVVRLPEIRTPILEKVCQYFNWCLQVPIDVARGEGIPEFTLEPELILELTAAANYLEA